MFSGNSFLQEHQFQLWVVYPIEMQYLNEKFQRQQAFLSKNVTRGYYWFEIVGRVKWKMRTLCTLSRHYWCIATVYIYQSLPVLQPRAVGHLMHCSCWWNMMFNGRKQLYRYQSWTMFSFGSFWWKESYSWKVSHVMEIACDNSGSQ